MSESAVLTVFEKLKRGVEKYPERAKKLGGSYLFCITGKEEGVFYLHLKGEPFVVFEEREADCTVTARDRDFMKVYKGVIPGYKAVLSGKLKIKGDLQLATKLGELFKAFKEEKPT